MGGMWVQGRTSREAPGGKIRSLSSLIRRASSSEGLNSARKMQLRRVGKREECAGAACQENKQSSLEHGGVETGR